MPKYERPPQDLIDGIITAAKTEAFVTEEKLRTYIRKALSGTAYRFPHPWELVESYRRLKQDKPHESLERAIRCKTVRTDSGVAPVTLLTKPYACPGKCVYCPTEVRMPKSYVASEPAAARALTLQFDPYEQVFQRVKSLETNGHEAKKIELIIKGGTWSAYPWDYRQEFIKRCFEAANNLGEIDPIAYPDLKSAQDANETATYRVIGLTIETRPDWITPIELIRLRTLGVTRVELGVQALDDEILELTKRGHDVAATVRATILLKDLGFKTDYHFLPGQPGSNPEKDLAMFRQLFEDPRFCPDMVKLYPCVVLPSAELSEWHQEGRFTPLEGETLTELLIEMQRHVPRYCRVSRLIRDFPSNEISGGNKVTNLRQTVEQRMKDRGIACVCLRCREVSHHARLPEDATPTFFIDSYENAGGTEYFLSMEDPKRIVVFSFLRLRIPNTILEQDLSTPLRSAQDDKLQKYLAETLPAFPELEGAAFVRELHTYGQALHLQQDLNSASQHKGHGRRLMQEAERIATESSAKSLAVISGIGVREYYRKLGYELKGTYMIKTLNLP